MVPKRKKNQKILVPTPTNVTPSLKKEKLLGVAMDQGTYSFNSR